MAFAFLVVAALVPPSAFLVGIVRAWRRWPIRWRIPLLLPAALSAGCIVATLCGPLYGHDEGGAFLVVMAYIALLFTAALTGGIIILVHAARVAAMPKPGETSTLPANER